MSRAGSAALPTEGRRRPRGSLSAPKKTSAPRRWHCHGNGWYGDGGRDSIRHDRALLPRPSLCGRHHSGRDLAPSALHPRLPGRRGIPWRTRDRGFVRNGSAPGSEVRPWGRTPTRAQNAAVQISRVRPEISRHPRHRPQHLLPATSSRPPIDPADIQSRSDGELAGCRCRRRKRIPSCFVLLTTGNLTMPRRLIPGALEKRDARRHHRSPITQSRPLI